MSLNQMIRGINSLKEFHFESSNTSNVIKLPAWPDVILLMIGLSQLQPYEDRGFLHMAFLFCFWVYEIKRRASAFKTLPFF